MKNKILVIQEHIDSLSENDLIKFIDYSIDLYNNKFGLTEKDIKNLEEEKWIRLDTTRNVLFVKLT